MLYMKVDKFDLQKKISIVKNVFKQYSWKINKDHFLTTDDNKVIDIKRTIDYIEELSNDAIIDRNDFLLSFYMTALSGIETHIRDGFKKKATMVRDIKYEKTITAVMNDHSRFIRYDMRCFRREVERLLFLYEQNKWNYKEEVYPYLNLLNFFFKYIEMGIRSRDVRTNVCKIHLYISALLSVIYSLTDIKKKYCLKSKEKI